MKILVAGIGNIFLGDDGFGCEVARQLQRRKLPAGVSVVDFGIRGMDLGYSLMKGYNLVVLLDTLDRDVSPGTVMVIEPELKPATHASSAPSGVGLAHHGMDPARVLAIIASQGGPRSKLLLLACQPEYLGGDQGHVGLSTAVAKAVPEAVAEVERLLHAALADAGHSALDPSVIDGSQGHWQDRHQH